jgi:hypothetical protein
LGNADICEEYAHLGAVPEYFAKSIYNSYGLRIHQTCHNIGKARIPHDDKSEHD